MLPACDVETALRDVIITLFYETDPRPAPADAVSVQAYAETVPVIDGSDAADDPAIWINERDPAGSWVVGTNKRRGLEVYDLAGARHGRVDAGQVNNVDLRTVDVSGAQVIVVGGTNRTASTIDVWALDRETGALTDLLAAPIPADLDDPYGFCLYQSAKNGALYAIATDKAGGAAQWRLADTGSGKLRGERLRTIHTDTQPEGCVADDANGVLYIGEEGTGVWRLGAEPDDPADAKKLVATVRGEEEAEAPDADSPNRLTADVEGLAIYAPPAAPEAGYLVASSQGNWTYVVFDRSPPHAYRGTFRVAAGDGIDGTGETDGIDVVATPVGADYPKGLLVVQDGYNVDPAGEKQNQNFKYVSWADVADALALD